MITLFRLAGNNLDPNSWDELVQPGPNCLRAPVLQVALANSEEMLEFFPLSVWDVNSVDPRPSGIVRLELPRALSVLNTTDLASPIAEHAAEADYGPGEL